MRPLLACLCLLVPVAGMASAVEDPPVAHADLLEDLPDDMRANLVDPFAERRQANFADGEQLRFKLGWSLFTVARTELEVRPVELEEREALRISVKTRTNGFADAFYKVRNLSTSWVSPDVSQSFRYTAVQDEGGRERDTAAIFHPEESRVHYENRLNGEVREPVPILPGTFDPVGIVFFVRTLDFEVGDELVIPTSNGKEFFFTIVRVVDKVERRFAYGRREAWVLEPDIKDLGGVFKRSPDGKVRFYFSADDQKLPLRMESEVAVGSFWAELTPP
jgi:hypothetical protein